MRARPLARVLRHLYLPRLPEPHPLYVYGPVLFVGLSFVLSAAAAPFVTRRARRRFGPFRKPLRARALCLLATIFTVWLTATLVGFALLLLPMADTPDRLPGDHLDGTVVAHMVPTVAWLATDRLVARLEEGGDATRWTPAGQREARLVLAARLDDDPDRAVARLADSRFRTHAGRFAAANPSPAACTAGLDALAEAVQGAALKDLMEACRNAPGDVIGYAAFKVGDFMISVGPETESIISRQLRTPLGEPTCFAEGPDLPEPNLPVCRLEYAELHPKMREAALDGVRLEEPFARAWRAAIVAEQDAALDETFCWTIDPARLLDRPFLAVMDVPIAVYEDIRKFERGRLTPGQSAWVRIAIAAERSAMGRHVDAAYLVEEAFDELDLGNGAAPEERTKVRRLAATIALRAGDIDDALDLASALEEDDPLRAVVERAAAGELVDVPGRTYPFDPTSSDGAAIAAALEAEPSLARGGTWRLASVRESERPVLREWLREAFPACTECGYFAQLDRLTVRLDAATALGDDKLAHILRPIIARFEAVFLNRPLAISLRGADPHPKLD